SLSWTGTTSSEKITALNFSGSGVTNPAIIRTSLDNGNSKVVSGDYNFLMSATTFKGVDAPRERIDYSIGFAKRLTGGAVTQACAAIGSRGDTSPTEIGGSIETDAIAKRPIWGDRLSISNWDAASFTITPSALGEKEFYALGM
ncbi:MAG: hypothetical protein GWO10_21285, partial [candidate division Zixibacteria bacterium]|nr:hypothetical protein [Gammaproteobacteria bacterium]NIR25989.1 hypothetical protein [Gammaproteobacteria bacterium]NIR66234.1 hypothetical protein [candidate division Zixibacteria bacterium]NIW47352.1 hypothetical protein [Gammaproteobacteria bacterium]NIX01598.1 hypothetical protein [Phycisphaerae bacterium]